MKIMDKRTKKQTKLRLRVCPICLKTFGTHISGKVNCSRECGNKVIAMKVRRGENRNCLTCDKVFWSRPSEDRRGSKREYCSIECLHPNKKLGLPRGEYYSYDGYVVVSSVSDGRKQIKKHRLIMEGLIGRRLKSSEIVHHINGNKLDNSPENLQICTRTEHNHIHRQQEREALNEETKKVRPKL